MKNLRKASAMFALAALFAVAAYSQAVNGTLLGTVTDSSGATIANAKVTITETNTGIIHSATTNASGNYSFPDLPPGKYSVTVEQTGFKKESRADNDTSGPAPANPAAAQPELPVAPSTPHRPAPQLKFVSREADNPASVSTSPPPSLSPTVARKVSKRRKLAVHLHQSHHFRRPRVRQIGAAQTQGFVQPNGFGSTVTTYAPGAYAQPSGFGQSSFGVAPAAIKPRPSRARHASKASSGGISSQ